MITKGIEQIIGFDSGDFKNLKVWKVCFEDGQKVMLYKLGNEWLQHNESDLDSHSLLAIGEHIDQSLIQF